MSIRMDDVAKRAGVSKSTVSLVLNDKPGVSPELKNVVLQAARDLGYKLPEHRPIRKEKPRQKNFTIVHHVGNEPHDNIYGLFTIYLQGIRAYAQQENINITAISGYRKGNIEDFEANILHDQTTPLDGLILMGAGIHRNSALLQRAISLDIPLVVLSRNWPDLPVSTVSQDHTEQALIALDHLMALGHRKIGFVASKYDQDYEWFTTRLDCYRKKMGEINAEDPDDLISIGINGIDAARSLLTQQPDVTAIFALHDERAIQAIKGVTDMGLKVPGDVSVIGLNNSEDSPDGYPKLTTVSVPHFDLGYLAAELLLKQIKNKKISYANITIQSKLIKRESCRNIKTN